MVIRDAVSMGSTGCCLWPPSGVFELLLLRYRPLFMGSITLIYGQRVIQQMQNYKTSTHKSIPSGETAGERP